MGGFVFLIIIRNTYRMPKNRNKCFHSYHVLSKLSEPVFWRTMPHICKYLITEVIERHTNMQELYHPEKLMINNKIAYMNLNRNNSTNSSPFTDENRKNQYKLREIFRRSGNIISTSPDQSRIPDLIVEENSKVSLPDGTYQFELNQDQEIRKNEELSSKDSQREKKIDY